jgi:predicted nucleic acid-binding protein
MQQFILDSSFVIDWLNELGAGRRGPALAWLQKREDAKLWLTPVTLAEVLEGANDARAVEEYLARFSWQGLHRAHAARVARLQRRSSQRMGENDAWQVATADLLGAAIVGHDRKAFARLGALYEDHRKAATDR